MSTTNYPSATSPSERPRKDFRGVIIGILVVGLLGTWGYLLYNNNKHEAVLQTNQQQIAKVSDEKSDLQKNFDATLVRLDSISGNNNELQGKLSARTGEISKLKIDMFRTRPRQARSHSAKHRRLAPPSQCRLRRDTPR